MICWLSRNDAQSEDGRGAMPVTPKPEFERAVLTLIKRRGHSRHQR